MVETAQTRLTRWRVLPNSIETHVPVLSPVFFRAYVLLNNQKDVYILVTWHKV